MPLIAWLALAFCIVATLGGAAIAGIRAFRLWRTISGASRAAGDAVASVLDSAAAAETRAVGLSGGGARLEVATTRLQTSLAELAAIRAALGEAQGLLGRLRGIVPSK
jgi:hypothetical protein